MAGVVSNIVERIDRNELYGGSWDIEYILNVDVFACFGAEDDGANTDGIYTGAAETTNGMGWCGVKDLKVTAHGQDVARCPRIEDKW